jgi:hypothetical protein
MGYIFQQKENQWIGRRLRKDIAKAHESINQLLLS